MKPIVTFFGTQPYEQESFDALNRDFGFEFRYFKGHLSRQTVVATHGAQAACIFVNDTADAEVMRELARNGVRLLALRCAGYNNVDLEAARTFNIPVVRVPAYSPHAVAEYTVAMMLSLNRKIPRASWRTRDGNFSLQGLMGFDMNGKKVGIGQLSLISLDLITPELKAQLAAELKEVKAEGRDTVLLVLTDIMKEGSELLMESDDADIVRGALKPDANGWMAGVMSRKKQVVPPLQLAFKA